MESQAVGQVVALTGKASIEIDGSSTPLEIGSPVFKGGVLTTEAESHIEVRFVDDTMLSQGPHSEVSIDDYVYDQADTASAILLDLTEGTLRTITGKIADENPEGFEVTTPLATLGIRGTDFSVIHLPDSGTKVVLNQISENHILIVTDQFGNIRYLNDPGTFVTAKEDEPISTVEVLSEEERKELLELTPFTTLPNDGFTEEAGPSDQAGEEGTGDQESDQTETEQQESETTTGLEIVAEGVGGAGPAEVQSALEALQTTIAEAGVESAEVMDALQVLEAAIYEADGGIESQEVINALLVLESAVYEAASEEVITAFQTLESSIYEAVAAAEQEALQEALSGTDEEQFDPTMLDNLPAPGAGGDPSETESELTGDIFDPTPEDPFTTPQSDPFAPQGSLYQPSSSLYDPVTGTTTLYGTTSTSSEPTTTTTSEQTSGTESTSEADSVLVSSTSDTGTTQPPQDTTQSTTSTTSTTSTDSGQTTTDTTTTEVIQLADEPVAPTDLILVAGDGGETLMGGAGNDTLLGGLGVDSFYGGAGNDEIIILGGFDAGVYSGTLPGDTDLATGSPAYTPDAIIDGGTGFDTLISYGTADYTGVTITGIEEIIINSDVIFTWDQFNSFNDLRTLYGTIEGYHRVTLITGDQGIGDIDLGSVTITNIDELIIEGGGTVDLGNATTTNIDEIIIDDGATVALTTETLASLESDMPVSGTGTITSSGTEDFTDFINFIDGEDINFEQGIVLGQAPTALLLDNTEIDNDGTYQTDLFTPILVSVVDPDSGDEHTISLTSDSDFILSQDANGNTTIVAGDVILGSHQVTVSVVDYVGHTLERTFTIELVEAGEVIPVGQEFQVNTTTASAQYDPSVAALADGGYVVTWMSLNQDGDNGGIYGQRYDVAGNTVGTEFLVNTETTTDLQELPRVTGLINGGFVVIWTSSGQDGDGKGVYGQRYDSSGNEIGGEFQVNTHTAGDQDDASVTALNDGGFVVIWESYDQDGSENGVFGQRYNSAGTKVGEEFQVNTYTTSHQDDVYVASLSSGGFVVTWESYGQDGDINGVFAQLFDSAGTAVGDEFQVNSYTTQGQASPSVTGLSDGGFVITWYSDYIDNRIHDVFGQIYDASGNPVGSEFLVNTYTASRQEGPSVTALSDGGFVVTWESLEQDGSSWGIFGQAFDSAGNPVGSEFQVNNYWTYGQTASSVTGLNDGSFVVAWTSGEQDGDMAGTIGQRFIIDQPGPEAPVDLYLTSTSLDENTTYVGTLSTLDPDTGYSYMAHTFSILDGSDADNFQIIDNGNGAYDLEMVSPVDYETGQRSYWITIEATGDDGLSYSEQFNITVNDVQDVVTTVTTANEIPLGTMEYVNDLDTELLSNGNYVVSWTGYGPDPANPGYNLYQSMAMIYGADGTPLDSLIQPLTIAEGNSYYSGYTDISPLADGGFVASWRQYDVDTQQYNIVGRIYDDNGQVTHNDFTIIADTSGLYYWWGDDGVTGLANGDFVVAYSYYDETYGQSDIGYAQAFSPNPDGSVDSLAPFQLNGTGVEFSHVWDIGSYPLASGEDTFIVRWWDGISEGFSQGFTATDGEPIGHESIYYWGPIYRETNEWYSVLDSGHYFTVHNYRDDNGTPDYYDDDTWDVNYRIYGPGDNLIEEGALFNDLPDYTYHSHTELSGNQFLLATWTQGQTSITNQVFEVDPAGGLIPGPPNYLYVDAQIGENIAGEVVAILSARDPDNYHLDLTYSIKDGHPNYRIDGNLLILENPIVNPYDPSAFNLTVVVTDPDQNTYERAVTVQPREVLLEDGPASQIDILGPYTLEPVTLTEGLANGDYVVAWNDDASVYMQIFDSGGTPVTVSPIEVQSIHTTSLNSLVELANGDIAVTYDYQYGSVGNESYARIYDPTGQPVSGEFMLTSANRPNESSAVVAALTGGGFVAAWVSEPVGGTDTLLHFDIYDASGTRIDGLYDYTSSVSGNKQVAIAGLENGDFVITYDVDPLVGDTMVYARVWDVDAGTWAIDEIELSEWYDYSFQRDTHWDSQVTGLSDGGFAVTWQHTYIHDYDEHLEDLSQIVTYAYQNGTYDYESSYSYYWDLGINPVIDSFDDGFIVSGMHPWSQYYQDNTVVLTGYNIRTVVLDNQGQQIGYIVEPSQVDGNISSYWDPDSQSSIPYVSTTSFAPDVAALDDGYFVVTYATLEDSTGSDPETTIYSQRYVMDSPFNSFVKIEGDESGNELNGEVGMNNFLLGYGGDDELYGNAGNDILSGGTGADVIYGEAGDDIIKGGEGDDDLNGGLGNDTFIIWGTWTPEYANANWSTATDLVGDYLLYGNATDHYSGMETIDGGDGTDTIATYGTINLSLQDFNISNVENLDTHSHVIIAADQFDQFGFSSISGEGEEAHILSFTGEGVVDLTTLTIDNIDEINIESGVELVLTEEQEATLQINVVESQETDVQLAEDSTEEAGTVEPIFGDDPSLSSETESVATTDGESTDDEPIFGDTTTSDPLVDSGETVEPLLADSGDDTAMDLAEWDSGTEEDVQVESGTDADALWLATQTEEVDSVV